MTNTENNNINETSAKQAFKEYTDFINSGVRKDDAYHAKREQLFAALTPFVGMPAQVLYWPDRRAATISKVLSDKKVEVRENKTNCIDFYMSEYEILDELYDEVMVFTKRKCGAWVEQGHKLRDGVRLRIGSRGHYIDPGF